MKLRLLRNATIQIELAGQCLLVDPMLAEPYTFPSLTWGPSAGRNPTVPLPCGVDTLLQPSAILVTHTHFDHFDRVAGEHLSKDLPLFCQPSDQGQFHEYGFAHVIPVEHTPLDWKGMQIIRTEGRHGRGLIGRKMGPVSGFIIQAGGEPRLYIAGDTIWCTEVQAALDTYQPDVIALNAGAAQFNLGAPIIMTAEDVVQACLAAPGARVVAVHMQAVNHCRLTRRDLADHVARADVGHQVFIPQDGETVLCQ